MFHLVSGLENYDWFCSTPTIVAPKAETPAALMMALNSLVNDSYSGRSCCLIRLCYRNFLSF